MFLGLNSSLVFNTLALSALGSYFCLRTQCSLTKSNFFWNRAVSTKESLLECEGQGKKYSVFLDLKKGGDKEDFSFKVVDQNAGGKVVWGPGGNPSEQFTDWGVAAAKSNKEEKYEFLIRVPKTGTTYYKTQGWRTAAIPCKKSLLKVKADSTGTCSSGGVLMSNNMKFTISNHNIQITNKFDWRDDFQPKEVFCAS